MSRPLLKLKPAAPEQVSGVTSFPPLPPRPEKREEPLNQLLTFIVIDRKPYHHADYAEATLERDYLQAVADRAPRKGRKQAFRVMKVLNQSGEQLAGKVVIADPERVDQASLDAACAAFELATGVILLDPQRSALTEAVRAYVRALRPVR